MGLGDLTKSPIGRYMYMKTLHETTLDSNKAMHSTIHDTEWHKSLTLTVFQTSSSGFVKLESPLVGNTHRA